MIGELCYEEDLGSIQFYSVLLWTSSSSELGVQIN